MKKDIIVIIGLLIFFNGFAQEGNWTTETLKDGKITVKSKIVAQQVNNKEKNVLYYVVETIGDINLENAETFMRNSANYKKFLENMGTTNEVKKISADAWITYEYFDNSFPMSDNYCVQQFELVKTNSGFYVSGKAVPNEYEMKNVSRIYLYNVVYKFEKIADKKTKLTIEAAFCPTGSIPKFMMNRWLKEAPARIASRLVDAVSK